MGPMRALGREAQTVLVRVNCGLLGPTLFFGGELKAQMTPQVRRH